MAAIQVVPSFLNGSPMDIINRLNVFILMILTHPIVLDALLPSLVILFLSAVNGKIAIQVPFMLSKK